MLLFVWVTFTPTKVKFKQNIFLIHDICVFLKPNLESVLLIECKFSIWTFHNTIDILLFITNENV